MMNRRSWAALSFRRGCTVFRCRGPPAAQLLLLLPPCRPTPCVSAAICMLALSNAGNTHLPSRATQTYDTRPERTGRCKGRAKAPC
jgi:hypothetical protein